MPGKYYFKKEMYIVVVYFTNSHSARLGTLNPKEQLPLFPKFLQKSFNAHSAWHITFL